MQNWSNDADISIENKHRFSEFERVTRNSNHNYKGSVIEELKTVNDSDWLNPGMRFGKTSDVMGEYINDNWAGAQLSDRAAPKGMMLFIEYFCEMLKVPKGNCVGTRDVVHYLLYYLDFWDPYFLLTDMPIQITGDEMRNMYRVKRLRRTLDPIKTEVFKIQYGWKFEHYVRCMEFIKTPKVAGIIRGERVFSENKDKFLEKEDILEWLVIALIGNMNYFENSMEEGINNFYEGWLETHSYNDASLDKEDKDYWCFAAIAAMLWLRSPHGLQYLIESHPIYASMLYFCDTEQKIKVTPESGGTVIIEGMELYTLDQLEVVAAPAGTCECCGDSLHCTKRVNMHGILNNTCYCGSPIEADDVETNEMKHGGSMCHQYFSEHGYRIGYICQKCLEQVLNPNSTPPKFCHRAECPNLNCRHHMGSEARMAALTQNRRNMLAAPQNY